MTSKEALFDLIFEGRRYINDMRLMNLWKIINDDLEILDILKKNLFYDNKNHVIKMKEIRKSRFNFDYENLKEWLESEK